MFALGLLSWMYTRPTTGTEAFLAKKFGGRPEILEANLTALRAGWNYGETTEDFASSYVVKAAPMAPGTYRNVTGNTALALAPRRRRAPRRPPARARLVPHHAGVRHPPRAVVDEAPRRDDDPGRGRDRRHRHRARASYGGSIGVTTTSGPGIALKSETIGLAVSLELPLVVVDIQRGGPSTGLPTKTEQADLLQVMYGRNGESPVPVVAAQTPADCFDAAMDAVRIATTYRTPVILLSDGYLANGSEPWSVPSVSDLPEMAVDLAAEPNAVDDKGAAVFRPYLRDPETLARPWAVPGTPGLEHRIGGIEKADVTGDISYDPDNHDRMVRLRAAKVAGVTVPDVEVDDPTATRRSSCSAGARPTGRSRRPRAPSATPATTWPARTCATSTPSPRTSARSCAATSASSCRR